MSQDEDHLAWYVVHTRPRRELMVAGLLDQSAATEVFLPEAYQQIQNKRKLMPLFPNYLFVRLNVNESETAHINRTPGVVRLISFGDSAQPLPDSVISALRTQLERVNADGGIAAHAFHVGDRVRLTDGALEGLEALFQGPMEPSRRVDVLLEFMGRLQEVRVDVSQLEAVRPRRPRRTRGRGRRIQANV
jgi:transcriptional antiterminator RfaH